MPQYMKQVIASSQHCDGGAQSITLALGKVPTNSSTDLSSSLAHLSPERVYRSTTSIAYSAVLLPVGVKKRRWSGEAPWKTAPSIRRRRGLVPGRQPAADGVASLLVGGVDEDQSAISRSISMRNR